MSGRREEPLATAAAVAGLAREVEALRRAVDPVRDLPERVEDLARLIEQLTAQVENLTARQSPVPPPSWLLLATDAETGTAPGAGAARQVLDDLCAWLGVVYLRYSDGAAGLPQCWLWHPDVVEELVWLMHAWSEAYQGKRASVAQVGDWHDRLRPGVVRRVAKYAGTCSVEKHQTRPGWDTAPSGAPTVPGLDEIGSIAAWWGSHRHESAPEPTAGGRYR